MTCTNCGLARARALHLCTACYQHKRRTRRDRPYPLIAKQLQREQVHKH